MVKMDKRRMSAEVETSKNSNKIEIQAAKPTASEVKNPFNGLIYRPHS